MKKALLFISLLWAMCTLSFAQQPLQTSSARTLPALRAGETFQDGFCYFNKAAIQNGSEQIGGVGVGQANFHIATAIQIPTVPNVTLNGIQFIQSGTANVTIFIGERAKGSSDAYTIVSQQSVTSKNDGRTINTFNFTKAVTTATDKEYVVGYETVSTNSEKGKFPLAFAKEASNPMANWVAYQQSGATNINSNKIQLINVVSQNLGNAIIVALCKDPGTLFQAPFFLLQTDLGKAKKVGTSLPAAQNKVDIEIVGMGSAVPTTATFNVIANGGTPETKTASVSNGIASLELGAINSIGTTNYTIELKTVNGKAISFTDKSLTTATYTVILLDPSNIFVRDAVLIERWTTERCPNCPPADKRLDEAYKKINFPLVVVAHHCGFGTDFLTVKGDEDFLVNYILKDRSGMFAPAFVLNRIYDKDLNALSTYGSQSNGMYQFPSLKVNEIVKQLNYVKNLPSEGKILSITRKAVGDKFTYTVTGKVSNNPAIKDDVYVTMYLTQDNITPKYQAGAGSDFIHNNALRKVITEPTGNKVTCNEDGTFSIDIENVQVPTDETEDKNFIIFIHHNPANKDYANRSVYAAVKINVATEEGATVLEGDAAPVAYANNGHIYINGMADSFVVYNISGQQVATSSNVQLPQGVYIVKIELGNHSYVSKVIVR